MNSKRSLQKSKVSRREFVASSAKATTGLILSGIMPKAWGQDRRLTTVGGVASTQYGRVRGLLKDGVHQFFSVPYGAATHGANRFMPPKEPAVWTGIRDHFQIRYSAPTKTRTFDRSPVVNALNRYEDQSEDCLTINVFTPGLDKRRRPVMVWLHGGGFTVGSGNYLLYDGTNLAKKEDVVVVAVNHRLNVFGFLHLADIGGESWARSTNVGLQDLTAALQWVQKNIETFGGDPDRVTIFGQSGGGFKGTTLMAMPSAEGLFHRSIAQSGVAFRGHSADDASEGAERLLAKLGLRNNQLDKLRTMNFRRIQEAYYSEPMIDELATWPVVDGTVLPRDQWEPTAPAYSHTVPMIVGSAETESGWRGPPPYELSDVDMLNNFTTILAKGDNHKGQRLLEIYKTRHPQMRNQMLWLTAESDYKKRWDAQRIARLKHEQGAASCYLYFFDWHSPVQNHRMGAYHTLDIPFVFYNLDIGASMTGSAQHRYKLGHVISAAWAAFAATGNPNHADMPTWPEFEPGNFPTMMFGTEVRVANDPNRKERQAIEALRGLGKIG